MSSDETLRRKLCRQGCAVLLLAILAWPAAAATCESLAELKLPNTTITTAQTVAAGAYTPASGSAVPYKDLPAFCRVAGVLKPSSDSGSFRESSSRITATSETRLAS